MPEETLAVMSSDISVASGARAPGPPSRVASASARKVRRLLSYGLKPTANIWEQVGPEENLGSSLSLGVYSLFLMGGLLFLRQLQDIQVNFRCAGEPAYSDFQIFLIYLWDVPFSFVMVYLLLSILKDLNLNRYLVVLFSISLRVALHGFPPFAKTCATRKRVFLAVTAGYCGPVEVRILSSELLAAVRNVNCTPLGHTQVQLVMTWILASPLVVPTLRLMWLNVGFVLLIYLPSIFLYWIMFDEDYYSLWDIVVTIGLCFTVSLLMTRRKYSLCKSEETALAYQAVERQTTQRLFHILKFMVPAHVILPMLTRPGTVIASQVDLASVLFVMICDFDEHASRLSPDKLLVFLNQHYTFWDYLCTLHGVTKIETVGEVYVCAVGVLPGEPSEGEVLAGKLGAHTATLSPLLRVAIDILCGEDELAEFKLGMHGSDCGWGHWAEVAAFPALRRHHQHLGPHDAEGRNGSFAVR